MVQKDDGTMKHKWHYNTHTPILRIPTLVGQVWELGYSPANGGTLRKFECVRATSNFDGTHMGQGYPPKIFLAKDETYHYLLIKEKDDA